MGINEKQSQEQMCCLDMATWPSQRGFLLGIHIQEYYEAQQDIPSLAP